MSNYSGPPPYGGQYSNAPFGSSFQHPPPPFNTMIPPPPPTTGMYGHAQQQQQQYPPFPPPNHQPGQAPYGNTNTYTNGAQYPQLSHGQVPYPPMPPPPFYNPYAAYNANMMFANGYPPSLPVQENASLREEGYNAAAQSAAETVQHEAFHSPTTIKTPQHDKSIQIPTQLNGLQDLAKLQTKSTMSDNRAQDNPQEAVHNGVRNTEPEAVELSSDTSDEEQHDMQLDSATTRQSDSDEAVEMVDMAQDSSTASESSFDPYASAPIHQSVDGSNEIRVTEVSTPPVIAVAPQSTLPGLGTDFSEPAPISTQASQAQPQAELMDALQEKKTLAVQAIQDLASRKIGYVLLSREDFDLDLLKELYLESGVPLLLPTEVPLTKPPPIVPFIEPIPNQAVSQTQTAPPVNQIKAVKPVTQVVEPPAATVVPNFNLPIATVASKPQPAAIVTSVPDETVRKAAQPPKTTSETPVSATNPGRQGYLARLLAAKEAAKTKATSSPTTTQAQDRSSYLAKLQAAKEAAKGSPSGTPATKDVSPSTTAEATPSKSVIREEPKKVEIASNPTKPNIDILLRQKLEALRKTQALNTPLKPAAANNPDKPRFDQIQQPVSSGHAATSEIVTPARTSSVDQLKSNEVSFFTPNAQTAIGDLPGLPGLSFAPPVSGLSGVDIEPIYTSPFPNGFSNNAGVNGSADDHDEPSPVDQQKLLLAANRFLEQISADSSETSRKRPLTDELEDSPAAKMQRIHSSSAQIDQMEQSLETSEEEGEYHEDEMEDVGGPIEHEQQDYGRSHFSTLSSRSQSYAATPQVLTPDLQAKEDAIRQLKQRILEATLRKSSKASTVTISKPLQPSVAVLEQAKSLEDRQEAVKEGAKELTAQEKILAAAKLQAQKHLEQIRRNQASLNAHADKAQTEADNASTGAERNKKLLRKAEIEEKLSSIEAIITSTETDLTEIKRQQEQLLSRIQDQSQARSVLMDELTELLQGLEAEARIPEPVSSPVQRTELPTILLQPDGDVKQQAQSVDPIESAEPISQEADAQQATQVESTTQTSNLEPIQISSSSPSPDHVVQSPSVAHSVGVKEVESSDSSKLEAPVQALLESIADVESPGVFDMQSSIQTPLDSMNNAELPEDSGITDVHGDNDTEDNDEGQQMEIDDDSDNEDDSYEPIDITPAELELNISQSQQSGDDLVNNEVGTYGPSNEPVLVTENTSLQPAGRENEADLQFQHQLQDSADQSSAPISVSSASSDDGQAADILSQQIVESVAVEAVAQHEPSLTNAAEPKDQAETQAIDAEASELVKETEPLTMTSISDSVRSPQEEEVVPTVADDANVAVQPNSNVLKISTDVEHAPVAVLASKHFSPYQSPLTQFSSYRFHPEYPQNVSGGFRSLTYNHNIDSKVELCKTELAGGVCDDPGCELQHFKDISLTDNTLLLQLGSVHEGTDQEQKAAYVAGLRDTINGMRLGGLRDVESIVAEIVAYRRRFLGDPSRVIANLNVS